MADDKIFVRGLRLFGRHGVLEAEQELGQTFIIDLEAETKIEEAGLSDNLKDTINYAEMCEIAERIVKGSPDQLVERVASRIAYQILSQFPRTKKVHVRIRKPHVALPFTLDSVGIEICRSRADVLPGGRLYGFQKNKIMFV